MAPDSSRRLRAPSSKPRRIATTLVLGAVGLLVVLPTEPQPVPPSLASSLQTTAEDLGKFLGELLRPRLMRAATRDLLFEPQVEIDSELAWGAGIGIDRSAVPTTYWQWGSNPGFQSLLVIELQREDAVVVLTNRGTLLDLVTGRGGYGAAKRIARRALGINGRWDLHRSAPGALKNSRSAQDPIDSGSRVQQRSAQMAPGPLPDGMPLAP